MTKNENNLMHNFHKAVKMMGRGMFFYTKGERPMHHGQGRLLELIREMQPVGQKDLVEKLDIRPSSLSEMLKKLETKGLIERRQDEQDKRNVVVSLTGEGQKVAEQQTDGRDEITRKMFAALNAEEQEQLNGLLEKLIASWKESFDRQEFPERRPCGPHGHGFDGIPPRMGHHRHFGFDGRWAE
ncbi:MarR family transcriptional regulator [Christensenellaceae bacterium OttesenSCG-928-K19]|nr:MarR family transcriptional regulator [Christensenellaceae bacterium OttesenSCG-928-K19]